MPRDGYGLDGFPLEKGHRSTRGSIWHGMMIGTGIAIGHRIADSLMGPPTTHNKTVVSKEPEPASTVSGSVGPDACAASSKLFQNCMDNYSSEISKCQFYFDMLNECRRGSSSSSTSILNLAA